MKSKNLEVVGRCEDFPAVKCCGVRCPERSSGDGRQDARQPHRLDACATKIL
jgi:hypothetical protein